jgi:outer membrane protein OmpA-like peptidoglycan-associated protein
MESRFRHDFGSVRVHSDEKAAESARALDALGFTVGRDIVFGPGQYSPGTLTGRQLLAHELTHVVQQRNDAQIVQRQTAPTAPTGSSPASIPDRTDSQKQPESDRLTEDKGVSRGDSGAGYHPESNLASGKLHVEQEGRAYRIVGFDIGSDDVKKTGIREALDRVVETVQSLDDPSPRVSVVGHESQSKIQGDEWGLSFKRAHAVRAYLEGRGVRVSDSTGIGTVGAPPKTASPAAKSEFRAVSIAIAPSGQHKPKKERRWVNPFQPPEQMPRPKFAGEEHIDKIRSLRDDQPGEGILEVYKTYKDAKDISPKKVLQQAKDAVRYLGWVNQDANMQAEFYVQGYVRGLADLSEPGGRQWLPKYARLEPQKTIHHAPRISERPAELAEIRDKMFNAGLYGAGQFVTQMTDQEYREWSEAERKRNPAYAARYRYFLEFYHAQIVQ